MRLIRAGALMLLIGFSSLLQAASFDCSKAAIKVEHLVCEHESLSQLDSDLNELYVRSATQQLNTSQEKNAQREWLRQRNDCRDAKCIELRYRERIDDLTTKANSAHPPEPLTSSKSDNEWPKLIGDDKTDSCREIFSYAKGLFHTKDEYIFPKPENNRDTDNFSFILGPGAEFLDEVNINQQTVRELPLNDNVFGQSFQPNDMVNERIILVDSPYNWKSKKYSTYFTRQKGSDEQVLNTLNEQNKDHYSIIEDSYRPPLIVKNRRTGIYWVVNVGQSWDFLADWKVYSIAEDGLGRRCTIRFRPPADNADELLPTPLRVLKKMLFKTSDMQTSIPQDEMTIQSEGMLRMKTENGWANAAVRPWAIVPDNTLCEKSHILSIDKKSSKPIYKQIELSTHALAMYYETNLHYSPSNAMTLSARVLNFLFADYNLFYNQNNTQNFETTSCDDQPSAKK